MTILCLGDIFAREGREAVERYLAVNSHFFDLIIVNGENSAAGFGITPRIADSLFDAGADVITTGNHVWNKRDIVEYMTNNSNILRPYNFAEGTPGQGYTVVKAKNGEDIAVVNLQGSVFMPPIDSAFTAAEKLIDSLKERTKNIVVDFHAEATSEKMALGYFLDGKASLVFGTHTHVQTNDAKILENGTGFCTDIGMCGSQSGVIGVKKEIIVSRFLTSLPQKFKPSEGKIYLHGIVAEIENGRCKKIDLLKLKESEIENSFK